MTFCESSHEWVDVNKPCVVCGGRQSHLKHRFKYDILPRVFELHECDGCSLIFNTPRIANLSVLYLKNYYVFQEPDEVRYRKAFEQVRRHLDPDFGVPRGAFDLLEVGSAQGHLLHVLRHLGYRVYGVEISRAAAETARRRFHVDMFDGEIGEYITSSSSRLHDIIWCNDVIEHVPDPLEFLRSCAKVLKTGGRLILDTPNGGAKAVRDNRSNWKGYNPFHVYFFNSVNLFQLCQKADLRVVTTFSYNNTLEGGLVSANLLKSSLRACLKKIGIWNFIQSIRQSRLNTLALSQRLQPWIAEKIEQNLGSLPWFSESEDARAELFGECQGNNLAVHAVKT